VVGLAGAFTALLAACRSPPRSQLYPAGSEKDDGYGDLAQKSARLLTSDGSEPPLFPPRSHRRARAGGDPYGGDPYGGESYSDDADPEPADTAIAPLCTNLGRSCTPAVPPAVALTTRYSAVSGLTGAIEGTVTWRGAHPTPVVTACGAIDNPSVRIGANQGVGGVLVYIEHVDIGRTIPSYGRPVAVGGVVAKRGCALAPALQIVTPLPAGVAIHGDATDTKLRVAAPGGAMPFELQAAGRIIIQAQPGVTRIEAEDGSLGAAWIIAADTPYYAITDDSGRFRIDELASGTYDVTFWRAPLAASADGKVVYGPPAITHRSIKVEAVRSTRLDVALHR
jgi:hypothetical protein